MKKENTFRIKCECCEDSLEIHLGEGQVIISIEMPAFPLWRRIKHAMGLIFKPSEYMTGSDLWVSPKRFKKFLNKLNQ